MERGTNCSHLFCTAGMGLKSAGREGFHLIAGKSLVSNGSSTDLGRMVPAHNDFSVRE